MRLWERPGFNHDIVALICIFVIMFFLMVFNINGPLRIILGTAFILFLPGFLLLGALSPKDKEISMIERIILSFALSITTVPLTILVLNYTPLGMKMYPILITLIIYMTVFCLIALYRGSKFLPDKQSNILLTIKMNVLEYIPNWNETSLLNKIFIICLLITIIVVCVSFYMFTTKPKSTPSSEFYLVNHNGNNHSGFSTMINSEEMEVVLGVINREQKKTGYSIKVKVNGYTKTSIGPFYLDDNEEWEKIIRFSLTKYHRQTKIQFILFKDFAQNAYRNIHLWLKI